MDNDTFMLQSTRALTPERLMLTVSIFVPGRGCGGGTIMRSVHVRLVTAVVAL